MKKLLTTSIAAGLLISLNLQGAFADVTNTTLPVFNNGTNVDVTTTGNNMNIKITDETQHAVGTANWHSFNIGKDAGVNVEFTAHNQTSLNYVDAAGGMSQIYGKFTDSGCYNCGYDGTGKVILVNPNGILFGNGANVDLNSFTATNMNAAYDKDSKTLSLTKNGNESDGIVIQNGAKIYGDKNVAFASENIRIKDSQITTNTAKLNIDNDGDGTPDTNLGKVKLVTADGVNFTYYNNGAVEKLDNVKTSADQMSIRIENSTINSGHIEARNASTNIDSQLSTKSANLKAFKAEKGSDGNIYLISDSRVITEKTNIDTVNATSDADDRKGGNVTISGEQKVMLNADNINAVGDVKVKTKAANGLQYKDEDNKNWTNDGNINADNTTINANNVTFDAKNIASVQNQSTVKGADINIKAGKRAQVVATSIVDGDIIVLEGNDVWFDNATVKGTESIKATADKGYILSNSASSFDAPEIAFNAATNVNGTYNLNNNKTAINAGNDIDVVLYGVENKEAGLIAEANNNVTIKTPGTLSVSRLVAKNGDMTLDANKIVSGAPLNNLSGEGDEIKFEGDTDDRALISVRNGKFTTNPDMEVTQSGGTEFTQDGVTYQVKHNIQYEDGAEKLLLINPRAKAVEPEPEPEPEPKVEPTPTPVIDEDPAIVISVNDNEARKLNRIPRAPEAYDPNISIENDKTIITDIYALAAGFEVEEDEEDK